MTAHSELRLLPWSGPDGKPCYLSTDDNNSHLSRLADTTEAEQLDSAAALVEQAMKAMPDGEVGAEELRRLFVDLTTALQDVLRVATSRGHRLSVLSTSVRE
ncbi:hypothetical protein ACFV14_37875 [Streptomyces zaomyceticus]|uniref:hypothetical protein n=1 Tax=Streptomyces zaomyceticus TaxID=68286 RepID=UPI003696CD73